MKNCALCSKVTGVIRILLGAAMIYFGVSKFGAWPEMQAFVGGAAHKLGLTFLSVWVWFWIAMIGEIVVGLMLILWFKTRLAALLTLVIMVFAYAATGWNILWNMNALIVSIASLVILWKGTGDWAVCWCNKWSCETKSTGGCCGGSCHTWWDEGLEVVEVE